MGNQCIIYSRVASASAGRILSAEAFELISETWQVGWDFAANPPPEEDSKSFVRPQAGSPVDACPLQPLDQQTRPSCMVLTEADVGEAAGEKLARRALGKVQLTRAATSLRKARSKKAPSSPAALVPADTGNGFGVELYEEDFPDGAHPVAKERESNAFTTFPSETLRTWLAEGKSAQAASGLLPMKGRLFHPQRLGDALSGALLGGLLFFLLWFTGLEPPASLRLRTASSQVPETRGQGSGVRGQERISALTPDLSSVTLELAQVADDPRPPTADAFSDQQALLAELELAREDGRQAILAAQQAIAQVGDRDQRLKASEEKLEALESKLRGLASQASTGRQIQRTALAPPESQLPADPVTAYQSYVKGLALYAAGRHADAEREFQAAVNADDMDARYHYFLGLSRLFLGKEAAEDFRRGSALEREQRPSRVFVRVALENVGGEALQVLNQFRP